MKKLLCVIGIAICVPLLGCGTTWVTDRKIETPEERKCVAEHELKLLGKVPSTLSGHDQDWDDAIEAAHAAAINTCCATRAYEFKRGSDGYTGRYREIGR